MLCLGRKPAVHNRKTLRSTLVAAKHLDLLGTPPTVSNDWTAAVDAATKGDWGAMGNDSVGDCVWADTAHALMLRTANASTIVIPTVADTLAAYSAHTGYEPSNPATDQGDDETGACEYLESIGFLGHKSVATAQIEPSNFNHLKWAVQLFGTCRLGVALPNSAMAQFNNRQPWDVVAQDGGIAGGHDVPIVKYDAGFFYIVTWARLQAVTPAFLHAYADEAHGEVYPDFIKATGVSPAGFDLGRLIADLQAIALQGP